VELPRLQTLYDTYSAQGLVIVAIDARRDTKQATKFIKDKGLSFTLLENGADDGDVVSSVFGVYSFPTSLLVDREGRVLYAHVGFEIGDEQKLEEEIRSLL
jgi:peroxiredoxin